jgi:hypothetical protein
MGAPRLQSSFTQRANFAPASRVTREASPKHQLCDALNAQLRSRP